VSEDESDWGPWDDEALERVASIVQLRRLSIVRIDGPIEPRDAAAMARAVAAERSPLEVEMRAVAGVEVSESLVSAELRTEEQALVVVGENLRHYLAALCDRPAHRFAAPHLPLLHELMESDGFTIRPIETQVFSTFIDIGVCPTADEPTQPASRSLIYDLPSDSWHGGR
jgi:hypothetical protein